MLMTSTFASIAPYLAESASAQPLCLDGKVWSDDEEACVDVEDAEPTVESEPTEEDIAEPTDAGEEGTDDPVDGSEDEDIEAPTAEVTETPNAAFGTSSLVIHMLFCNELGEVTTIEMSYLEENCPLLPGVGASFTVSVAGQTIASGNAELLGPAGPYGLDVPGVPEGDVTINQGTAPGFMSAVVYCIVKDDTNAVVRDWTSYPFSEGTVVVESLPEGTRTWCNFFQIPAPDEITFSVQTYACPQAVVDAGFTSYEDLRLQCVVPPEEIEIQFVSNDVPSQVTTSAGFVSFAGLPPGDFMVRELIPEGYGAPYAFCTVTGPNGQTIKARDLEILYDDYTVRLDDLDAPASAACEFFNIPGELGQTAAAGPGADDVSGDVAISKFLCPRAFSYGDWTAEKFATECTEPLPGIVFRLEQNGAAFASGTTAADGTLVLTSSQPPVGAFQIVEDIPSDYTEATTYCAPEPGAGETPQPGRLMTTDNGAITIDNAGAGVDCAWYNTLIAGGYGTSTLSVTAFGCPDGTDPESTDPLAYVLECSAPMPGLTIDVSETANSGQTKDTPQTAPTSVFFDELPDYQILVAPERPAEYLRPVAFCLVEDANGTVVMPLQRVTVDKFTEFPITLGVGGKGTCELYYVPGMVTNLIVFKSICPDPDTGVVRTREEWFTHCSQWGEGFEFSVSQVSKETQTATTGEFGSGGAYFTDLELGPVTLTETIPSAYGTPLVWCYDYLPDVQGPTEYVQQTVVNGSIEYTTVAGQERHCYWLNQPVAAGIDVWKSICPPGIDISTATYTTFSSACRSDASGITFTVSDGISVLATQKVGETYANRVVFPAYPGPVTVTESIPPDYGQPVVYCTTADPAMAPESVWQRMTLVSDGAIALAPAPAGSIWTCGWFNIPTDTGHIEIHKWQCPPEVDPRAELAELLAKCTAPMNDVTFISDGDAATAKDTVDGIVRFEVPQAGGFRVEERIPEGYGYPVVFCSYSGGADMEMNFPERYELEGGDTITGTIPYAGFEMYCDWFNIPTMPGDITINKWTCPEGYDLHGYGADPKRDCTEATDGIAFSIEGEGVESQTATGDSVAGAAYWGDLEPGEYVITELVPEGIASHFVLDCSGGRVNGIQSYPLTDDDYITVLLADGDRIVCNWYNVPESEWGWVTVTKHWCTTATFVSDVDCEIYEGGVSFELRDDGGDTAGSGTTSEYGTVSFGELGPGTYSLDEVGYDWCAIDVSNAGPDGSIVVTSGVETSVAVFNCSIDPPAGGKQVPTKYPNTGVEPAKTPAPRDESVISR
jgi:hypothetical protein